MITPTDSSTLTCLILVWILLRTSTVYNSSLFLLSYSLLIGIKGFSLSIKYIPLTSSIFIIFLTMLISSLTINYKKITVSKKNKIINSPKILLIFLKTVFKKVLTLYQTIFKLIRSLLFKYLLIFIKIIYITVI
jgi:hypothetical protein